MVVLGSCLRSSDSFDKSLKYLNKAIELNPNYAEALINRGLIFLNKKDKSNALTDLEKAHKLKPHINQIWHLVLNLKMEAKDFENTISLAEEMVELDPVDEKIFATIALCYQHLNNYDDAVVFYNKAISIKPDYAEAWTNLGSALKNQGNQDEAIEAYNKAISIKPDYAEAYYNMGITLEEQLKLDDAIQSYKKALSIEPGLAEANENFWALNIQLRQTRINIEDKNNQLNTPNFSVLCRPKYQIYQAIYAFLKADQSLVIKHLKGFDNCDRKLAAQLTQKEKIFCSGYHGLLKHLSAPQFTVKPIYQPKRVVFHLGESHCLSYAHHNVAINGTDYGVKPKITFGGKAFHFSQKQENKFKAITKANFDSLPDFSKVFISFGEIDCRINEGFISAVAKHKKPIENLIADTVKGYVKWFFEQNQSKNHTLFFFNVPAPTYQKKSSSQLNKEAAKTIKLFNNELDRYLSDYDYNIIDVFQFTVADDGFSNGLFHIDNRHLSSEAISKIEQQIGP